MKKYYFHKDLILIILFFGIGTFLFAQSVIENPKSIQSWIIFSIGVIFLLIGIYFSWIQKENKEFKPISNEDLPVEFKENTIVFPKKYYYKYSNIKPKTPIKAEEINEINLNTFPPSFVINSDEVIFIPNKLKEKLEDFGIRNNIEFVNRFDIWSAINDPFLDTEFNEEMKLKNIQNLVANGIAEKEIAQIRKRIKWTMLLNNSIAWEWMNLGQFDYLNWTWITKEKYWWSMEIALRNYKKKEIG